MVEPETVIAWRRRASRDPQPTPPHVLGQPLWGAPGSSATWRALLKSHVREIVAADFFVVPTVRKQILLIFVFLILAHHRRRCNQSLEIDCPDARAVHPAEPRGVVEIEHLGSLHHHHDRAAA